MSRLIGSPHAEARTEKIEEDPQDGQRGNGEEDAQRTRHLASAYHAEQYQDGVDPEDPAHDAGRQEVAFELLDGEEEKGREQRHGRRDGEGDEHGGDRADPGP